MLAGHFVYTADRRVGQVGRILNDALTGPGGMPAPAVTYELVVDGKLVWVGPIPSGERPFWMTDAQRIALLHTAPRMLPACSFCDAPVGHPCVDTCPAGTRTRIPDPVQTGSR